MSAGDGDPGYAELVEAVEKLRRLIAEIEASPPSAKRDQALALLRERQGAAIRRLSSLRSERHSN